MTFSYSDALTTDRDKVRLRIGDTQRDAGPRPDKRNFSDEEISFLLTDEGNVVGAIGQAFEVLANEWESFSISERLGEVNYDAKEKAQDYDRRAAKYPHKSGGLTTFFGLNYRSTDDAGDDIEPFFQRKQFETEQIDWDVAA